MSRAGYNDDFFDWHTIMYRGQVASTIKGKKGQAFLRELADALDAMPEKRLIAHDLQTGGNVCAIGSVGARRGLDMDKLDPEDPDRIAAAFGITHQLVREIEYMNDEGFYGSSPEERWKFMRNWVEQQIKVKKQVVPLV